MDTPKQPLADSLKYQAWRNALAANGAGIEALRELYLHHKPDGELLFALLEVQAHAKDGSPLLPILLLRGRFVMVVIELTTKETGEKSLLLVSQNRLPTGGRFYSHTAGMTDSETDPVKTVIKEVREETGLTIGPEVVQPLYPDPLYTSDGILDESGLFYLVQLELPAADIHALQGAQTGADGEPEHITVEIVSPTEAFRLIRNVAGQLCNQLYARAVGFVPPQL